MSPEPEDGTPSPEPSTEQDSGTMAVDNASTEDKSSPQGANGNTQQAKSNAKDPNRPRRKKARRACFACQRAHLTCGDERPCLRCIKRGLQDQCHDGVRKKAKYLHDAPPEALVPAFAGNYHMNGTPTVPGVPGAQVTVNGMSVSQPHNALTQTSQSNYTQYGQVNQPAQMAGPMVDNSSVVNEFANQQNVETPTQYQSISSVSPTQDITAAMDPTSTLSNAAPGSFDNFVDHYDQSLINFNLSDLNFGNHYGALEFGILGQMSSGAVGTPDVDAMNSVNHPNNGNISYDGGTGFANNFGFDHNFPSWQAVPDASSRHASAAHPWGSQDHGRGAFLIGDHNGLGQSPHSQDLNAGYNMSPGHQFTQPDHGNERELLRQSISQVQQQQRKPEAFPGNKVDQSRKRRRNTADIYSSVQAPYSYTQGFHALTAFLQKRFPSKKTLRIAKALATIRPSFISCNQHLNHDDLIFMERCFQRTLYEYEDFVNHYGTPTIICRRTGEVAAVSKEFSLVTGWRRDVLLGKEPNLNVNTGGSGSGSQTGSSSRGAATPRIPNLELDPGRPQALFLAELMDEDSVVQFYDDFAELAFGASRTSIIGAPCSLLKYRTKDDPGWGPNDRLNNDSKSTKKGGDRRSGSLIRGQDGMDALGQRDGRVDCSMCWTVKRDVFDIPMLVVMNFLPII